MAIPELWSILHDAELTCAVSDPLARRLTFTFDIPHIRKFLNLAEATTWYLIVDGVLWAKAASFELWPGPEPDMTGLTKDQQNDAASAYLAMGRILSIDWTAFESSLSARPLRISDARLAVIRGTGQTRSHAAIWTSPGKAFVLLARIAWLFHSTNSQPLARRIGRLSSAGSLEGRSEE